MSDLLVPHLFRKEAGKIAAVLVRYYGLKNIEIAEDITSETFLLALETWPYKGVPENPTAWLYTVARNKAKNHIRHTKIFDHQVKDVIKNDNAQVDIIDLSNANIRDSQLQTLFALCHPSIPMEAQIALCLRILCGFGIDEIASAFLANRETVVKRLQRAKEKLRQENMTVDLPDKQTLHNRLDSVVRALYLLFSEGYHSETHALVIREELCFEAIRLMQLLAEAKEFATPSVHAALALMYFHASRLKARKNRGGELVLYEDQDRSLWNHEFIAIGARFLNIASTGNVLTKYHLEACIAYWHTVDKDSKEKWEAILQLYNKLLQIEYSPIAALNRTFALSKANGIDEAIEQAEKLRLTDNPYYYALLGDLYKVKDVSLARLYLAKAAAITKSIAEKNLLDRKIASLGA